MNNDEFMSNTYGLKSNPFVGRIAQKPHLDMWYDREDQLEKWKKIITPPTLSNKIAIIIGNYGRGKSLSLLKVIDEAENYKEIFSINMNLKTEEKSKPGLDFILRIFKTMDFNRLADGKTEPELKKAIERLPDDFEEPKKVLSKIFIETKSEVRKLAIYFLKGEIKPSATDLKKIGVIRKLETVDIAKEYLTAILGFMKGLRYNTLLICIDEFEYLFSLVTKGQQSIYLALLRGLYDLPLGLEKDPGDIAKIIFFIATSESGWTSLKEAEHRETLSGGPTVPLVQRIEVITTLDTFDKNQTRNLIEKRLSYSRTTGKFENKPLIPFTDTFVDYIYDKTKGEPRKIIISCDHVLDSGIAKKIHLLSAEFAQKVLEERGF